MYQLHNIKLLWYYCMQALMQLLAQTCEYPWNNAKMQVKSAHVWQQLLCQPEGCVATKLIFSQLNLIILSQQGKGCGEATAYTKTLESQKTQQRMMSTRQHLRPFLVVFQMNGNLVKKECLNSLILEWAQRNIEWREGRIGSVVVCKIDAIQRVHNFVRLTQGESFVSFGNG